MKCPNCQAENPIESTLCTNCGTSLEAIRSVRGTGPTLPQGAEPTATKTLKMPMVELTRGTTFAGRYEIIEELGTGGMGRVYRVLDTKINEEVALKLLKPEIALARKTIERFNNELKIARKVTHKNVCRMHHINEEEGAHFITMEYVIYRNFLYGLAASLSQFSSISTL